MKKLLSILAITTGISTFSTTVISCEDDSPQEPQYIPEELIPDIKDKISAANNTTIKSDDLSSNASDNLTQNSILNFIGLTDEEKTYVKTSGTLNDNESNEITYDIYESYPTSDTPLETLTNNIELVRINQSAKDRIDGGPENEYPGFDSGYNIALLNQKQLITSGISNYSMVSDVNLSFDNDIPELKDGAGSPTRYEYTFNNMIYAIISDYIIYRTPTDDSPDENGNYSYSTYSKCGENDFENAKLKINSSNGIMYGLISENDGSLAQILDISDPTNLITVVDTDSAAFPEGVTSFNDVWNLDGTLYIGTNAGLCKSNDDGTTYSLVEGTDGLNINKIIYDGSQMILCTTDNGLYKSNNDFTSFSQISSTLDKTINQYSIFIDNKDILYYGITNGGLWSINLVTDSSLNSIQIETTNIKTDSDVRSIVQYYDGTLILLTNENIVYLTV